MISASTSLMMDIEEKEIMPAQFPSFNSRKSSTMHSLESTHRRMEFRYEELERMTKNFKDKIGEGGFGEVYKGVFQQGDEVFEVAVKRIIREVGSDVEEAQFLREMTTMASLQHRCLTSFIGFCSSSSPGHGRYLVYMFMPNGSLDKWIFNVDNKQRRLRWDRSYRVAIDVAEALKYLHHDCYDKVLHLDIKPENILLGPNLDGSVTDFDLSKLMDREKHAIKMKSMRGTPCYMAPEYIFFEENTTKNTTTGNISEKADVYSYGMMLFEIVRGERNNVPCNMESGTSLLYPTLVSRMLHAEEQILQLIDKRLLELEVFINEHEVRVLLHVALWCVQERPDDRPSMETVLDILEKREVPQLRPEPTLYMLECECNGEDALIKLIEEKSIQELPMYNGSFGKTIYTLDWLAARINLQRPDNSTGTVKAISEIREAAMDMRVLSRLPKEFTYEQI